MPEQNGGFLIKVREYAAQKLAQNQRIHDGSAIFRFDGQWLRAVVTHNFSSANREFTERNPIAPGRNSGAGRAALERRTIHIHDVQTDPEYTYGAGQLPFRTLLAIPMLMPTPNTAVPNCDGIPSNKERKPASNAPTPEQIASGMT